MKGRARRKKDERGVALLMVTGALVVLMVMLTEFQDEMGAEVAAATSARDAVQAEYYARSSLNLSRLLIATEPTIRAAIAPLFMMMKKAPPQLPVWEFSDRILGAFNGEDESQSFTSTFGSDPNNGKNLKLPGGHFELSVIDEDSMINVNQASSNDIARIRLGKQIMGLISPPQFNPIFEQKDGQGQFSDRRQTCQAMVDWADVDEVAFVCDFGATAQSQGVEDGYYGQLPKPYRRKNAPYDSLEELRLVRGIKDDFWATFIEPDPTKPKKRVMTVWGQGVVNVNTANPQTLHAVVCSGAPTAEICTDPTQAATFIMGVTMARGISMGAPLFGNAQDFIQMMTGKGQLGPILAGMGLKPVKFQSEADFAKNISTESKMFSIYSVGVKKGYKRETRVSLHAVVDFRGAAGLASPTASTSSATPGTTNPGTTGAVNTPNTGGQMVYFRVE
ncbi:MAG: type II secretion system protein GspK [Polyangiaceae bacterium]